MTQLRREFERSRMLLEMIKKREKLKRDQIQIAFELFELRLVHPRPTRTPRTPRTHRTHRTTPHHTPHHTPHTHPHTQHTVTLETYESQKEGVPLMDDPRELEFEREWQRERERERAMLMASAPSALKSEKATADHRKRRRRDSALNSSAPAVSSALTPAAVALAGGRPPAPAAKRPKTIVKLTHGQVYAIWNAWNVVCRVSCRDVSRTWRDG
jgi:hypothetical protein